MTVNIRGYAGDYKVKGAAFCQNVLLIILLAGCGSQRSVEQNAVASSATDCLVRETQAIASQPIDLETATQVVLVRCDYPGVLERSMAAEYPGFRDTVHQAMQSRYPEIVDSVRRGISLVRAKQSASRPAEDKKQ